MSRIKALAAGAAAILLCLVMVSAASAQGYGYGPRYNWTGLYFGAHLGGAWADSTATDTIGGSFTTAAGDAFGFSQEAFKGGAHLGAMVQTGSLVLGGELSLSGHQLQSTGPSPFFPLSDDVSLKYGPIFAATVRVGIALEVMQLYLKGGYAGANISFSAYDAVADVGYKQSAWHHGWTIGTGVEWALSPNLSVGLEYNYYDFGSVTKAGLNSGGLVERYRVDGEVHSVMGRINLRFGPTGREPATLPGYQPYK